MLVITCISDETNPGYSQGLVQSCDYYSLALRTLLHRGTWEGHRLKDTYLENFLLSLDPQEIVLNTDGYDAVFVSGEEEIIKKFNEMNAPVVFSTEKNCYPFQGFSEHYKYKNSKFKYLNSGGFIGFAGEILNLLRILRETDEKNLFESDMDYTWSNQYLWTKLYLKYSNIIKLDTKCSIFQTFSNDMNFNPNKEKGSLDDYYNSIYQEINNIMKDYSFVEGRIFNEKTKTFPCHLHFNSLYLKKFMFSKFMSPILPWIDK